MRRLLLAGLALLPAICAAQPPQWTTTDTLEHRWWDAQTNPQMNGLSCCGHADGELLASDQWHATSDPQFPFVAQVRGVWTKIPAVAVIAPKGEEPNVANRWRAKVWSVMSWHGARQGVVVYCGIFPEDG